MSSAILMASFDVEEKAEYRLVLSRDVQSKLTHCDYWAFLYLSLITNRVQYTDAMLKIPTSCGCFADNENHGHDVDADVLLIGLADMYIQ